MTDADGLDDPLPNDRVSADLRALTDGLPARLDRVADLEIEREPGTGLVGRVEIVPRRRGAVAVWWEQNEDDLEVAVAGCLGWELPRTTAGVETVRTVIEAAVAGAVEVRTGQHRMLYRVRLGDGSLLEDSYPTLWSWRGASWKAVLGWTGTMPYA